MTDQAARNPSVDIRRAIMRALIVLLFPLALFVESAYPQGSAAYEALTTLGVLTVFAGVLGRFWSIIYVGGRKARMVFQDGPYSICRHPLYLFSTVAAVGAGLMLGSLVMAAVTGAVAHALLRITARKEERFLRAEFGSDYDDYAARVPMILPRPSLFTTAETATFAVRPLKANFRDALVFLSLIPLATLLEWLKLHDLVPTFPVY